MSIKTICLAEQKVLVFERLCFISISFNLPVHQTTFEIIDFQISWVCALNCVRHEHKINWYDSFHLNLKHTIDSRNNALRILRLMKIVVKV